MTRNIEIFFWSISFTFVPTLGFLYSFIYFKNLISWISNLFLPRISELSYISTINWVGEKIWNLTFLAIPSSRHERLVKWLEEDLIFGDYVTWIEKLQSYIICVRLLPAVLDSTLYQTKIFTNSVVSLFSGQRYRASVCSCSTGTRKHTILCSVTLWLLKIDMNLCCGPIQFFVESFHAALHTCMILSQTGGAIESLNI